MPKRKRSYASRKRSYKRRRFLRRKRRKKRKWRPSRGIFAKTFTQKHRYSTRITLNPGTASVVGHNFRCNNLFDPDSTGVGHQPIGYDELKNLYTKYCVVGAKITARFISRGAGNQNNRYIVGIQTDDDSSHSTNINTLVEQTSNRSSFKVLSDYNGPRGVTTCVAYYSPRKLYGLGRARIQGMDDIWNTDIDTAVVGREARFHVVAAGIPSATDPTDLSIWVTIDFAVVWHTPVDNAGS